MAAPTETHSRCARKLSLKAAEALLNKALEEDDNSSEDYSLPATDLDSEASWRPDSKSDSDESFVIPPSPTNNKVRNISCVSIINASACTLSAMVNNAATAVLVAPVINNASCAPLAQVDNTAPDTPPVQVVNTDACVPSASVKNAALYVPGAPANNAATNAPLAPNNKADAPSPVDSACRQQIRESYYKLPDTSSQRLYISNCIKSFQPKRRYAGSYSSRQVTYEYSVTADLVSIFICKQAHASILGIKIAKINYVCDLIKKHNCPPEDKLGKHQGRLNKLSEEKKQEVLDFLQSIPKYRSHYTLCHNPHRHYLSPSLTQTKLHKLYVEKCASKAIEPVSSRMFSEIYVTERRKKGKHLQCTIPRGGIALQKKLRPTIPFKLSVSV
ncbi:hypothetical protein PoB_000350900 [Plakobranchus ocellatus]|uniref:Uncharacterized protein n=1 Tax=Plakobranchus ocellatus TaxID=259542 RepID=A0AAV3Y4K5_9GAST|nr:hypothetical protein PoB_000350900 [Plakobranchus ocellatus]